MGLILPLGRIGTVLQISLLSGDCRVRIRVYNNFSSPKSGKTQTNLLTHVRRSIFTSACLWYSISLKLYLCHIFHPFPTLELFLCL